MKKNYYLTLDTETATLPFSDELCQTKATKKKIAIAKPLVYDIGWVITDRKGEIVKQVNYLVQEIFFNTKIFNTAYYKEKYPLYLQKLQKKEIEAKGWFQILKELEKDLQTVTISTAYNACFDFKKAIPFTNTYLYHFYYKDFDKWLKEQYNKCEQIISNSNEDSNPEYLNSYFKLKDVEYPICDLWGIACRELLNNKNYKKYCFENKRLTASGLYFSTTAESAFQYITKDFEFSEDHTALSDALIEAKILAKVLKKRGITAEIEAFPFRILGETIEHVEKTKNSNFARVTAEFLQQRLDECPTNRQMQKKLEKISTFF